MRTRLSLHRGESSPSWSSRSRSTDDGPPPSPPSDRLAASVVGAAPGAPVDSTPIRTAHATPTDDMADPAMDRRRWRTGLTASAIGSVLHHLVVTPARIWGRMTRVQRTSLQIGSGLDVVVADMRGYAESAAVAMMWSEGLTPGRRGEDYADGVAAGHIVRTRPPTGSSVPMGTPVDYVVASSVSRPHDESLGDSGFVDHDATARLEHEAS
jgi:hypothetical protein